MQHKKIFLRTLRYLFLAVIVSFCIYLVISLLFWEYLVFKNKTLGYLNDPNINEPILFIPWENGIEKRKLYLLETEKKGSYSTGAWFSNSFLIPIDRLGGINLFKILPPKVSFNEGNRILKISSTIFFDDHSTQESFFIEKSNTFEAFFWKPRNFTLRGYAWHYWIRNNEVLILSKWNSKTVTIQLIDKRITNEIGIPVINLPMKQSFILPVSRFGFMKRVWYLDN